MSSPPAMSPAYPPIDPSLRSTRWHGHDHGDRIRAAGRARGARRAGLAGTGRDVAVARHGAVRDAADRLLGGAHEPGRQAPVERHVEHLPLAREVLVQLAPHVVEASRLLGHLGLQARRDIVQQVLARAEGDGREPDRRRDERELPDRRVGARVPDLGHGHMMPHVATDSAEGVRWDLTRVFADGDAARRAMAELDAAAAALEAPGDDIAQIRAALDAHDEVARDRGGPPRRVGLRRAAHVGRPGRRRGARPGDRVGAGAGARPRGLPGAGGTLRRAVGRGARRRPPRALPPLPRAPPGGARVPPRSARRAGLRGPRRRREHRVAAPVRRHHDRRHRAVRRRRRRRAALAQRPARSAVAPRPRRPPAVDRGRHRGARRRGRDGRRVPGRRDRRPAGRGPAARPRRPDGRDAVHRPDHARRRRVAADGDRGPRVDRPPLVRAQGRGAGHRRVHQRRPHGARRRPAGGALERGRDARPRRLRGPRRRARRAGPRADGERPDRRRAARRQVGGRLLRAAAAGLSVVDPDDLPRHAGRRLHAGARARPLAALRAREGRAPVARRWSAA